jgi:hypothetical protein
VAKNVNRIASDTRRRTPIKTAELTLALRAWSKAPRQ